LNRGHSNQVAFYKQECKSFILIFWTNLFKPHDSGFSFVDGDSLFVSNLSNGIDMYSLRTMQRLRHYEAPVTINVPLQVALARQNLDRVVVGGVDGAVRVYDRTTGELVHRLGHKVKGRVQVVDVSDPTFQHPLTNKVLGGKHT
jgi:WD40 repeat protein